MTKTDSNTIAIAAGGTGGHLFPAMAVAEVLASQGLSVVLLTDERGQQMSPNFPADQIFVLPSGGIAGLSVLRKFISFWSLAKGTIKAHSLIKSISPLAVIGFGGYPSVPPLLAARSLKLPCLLHEQNAHVGKANRLLAKFSNKVALPFSSNLMKGLSQEAKAKSFTSGNPVRQAFLSIPAADRNDKDRLTLLIMGGSLGARVMSEEVPKAIKLLTTEQRSQIKVYQQARSEDLEQVAAAYDDLDIDADVRSFFNDVDELISRSDLLISRAGASTVAEIAAAGRASILVPYPYAADDHQTQNAAALAATDAAILVPQEKFTSELIAEKLVTYLKNKKTLVDMGAKAKKLAMPEAAQLIADMAIWLAKKEPTS